jgi:hypothetical protein
MNNASENHYLEAVIENGKLVISIGLNELAFAATHGPYFFGAGNPEFEEPRVTDVNVFADAILDELLAEQEDGTTLVHEMFDKAAERAVENGCEGIELPEPPKYDD